MIQNKEKIEKELNLIKCPSCGKYNFITFIKKYGRCNGCKEVLDEKANFKYTMIKKLHLFKKSQIGHLYKRDVYEENRISSYYISK